MSENPLARVQRLCAQFDGLRTFDDANQWDAAALDAVASLQTLVEQTRLHQHGLLAQADELATAHAAAPFFKRWFRSRAPERALRVEADRLSASLHQIGGTINDLLERIDYTPNNEKERKALLKELRSEKKGLQVQKREIAAHKRAVNHAAREASASAGINQGWIFTTYDSKQAASERREIRRQKIAQLAPYENAKTAIERQILDIDRRIMWIERFGKDED